MIELLQSVFRDELRPYGEALKLRESEPDADMCIADWLEDASRLDIALSRQAQILGSDDRRPLVSAWTLSYFGTLLPPVVAAATLLNHGFPVGLHQVAFRLNAAGTPSEFSLRQLGQPFHAADPATRYDCLLWRHLQPLIGQLCRHTRIAPRILWGNAARRLDSILALAASMTVHDTKRHEAVLQDRERLLLQPLWHDGRRNPLFFPQRRVLRSVHGRPTLLTLHRQCCLFHMLPTQAPCEACPLTRRRCLPSSSTNQRYLT